MKNSTRQKERPKMSQLTLSAKPSMMPSGAKRGADRHLSSGPLPVQILCVDFQLLFAIATYLHAAMREPAEGVD